MLIINKIKQYIFDVLGSKIQVDSLGKSELHDLPLYLRDSYLIYRSILFNKSLILFEPKEQEGIKVGLIAANVKVVKERMGYPVVVLLNTCTALQRRRLIERGINFIVPGLQLFLPELLIDLREAYKTHRRSDKEHHLRPSAQFLVIYHLINSGSGNALEAYNFKSVAAMTGYSPMAITLAAENLVKLDLIDIIGTKDKTMSFKYDKKELWEKCLANGLLRNPLKSRVYTDNIPTGIKLLKSNISALSEYSDLNPGNLRYYAIDRNDFRNLQERNVLENLNKDEGRYSLEVYKYSPRRIWGDVSSTRSKVDPFSLYLTMRDKEDERIEMALEQLIREHPW